MCASNNVLILKKLLTYHILTHDKKLELWHIQGFEGIASQELMISVALNVYSQNRDIK